MKRSHEAFRQLTHLLKPYRWHMAVGVFLAWLPAYFAVWTPYFIGKLVDQGLIQKDFQLLLLFSLGILFIKTMIFFLNSMVTYLLSAFGLQILVDYRDQLLKRIFTYPISFFDRISSGKLTTRLTSDINSLQELFSSALVPLIGNAFLILGVIVAMFLMNWRLALVSFTIVPFIIFVTFVFHDRIRRRFGLMRQALSNLNSFIGESFSGNRDLQVLGALQTNQEEFDRYSRRLQVRYNQAVREYALFNPLIPFITCTMDAIILSYGSWQVLHGMMSVGEVVAFLAYASHFGYPIRDFAEKFTVLQQALAAIDRLVEVSTHTPELNQGTQSYAPHSKIEFDQVEFSYKTGDSLAVSKLNFEVRAGEKIALLGETGSGKTTTCSLFMRFYEPSRGTIWVDGKDLRQLTLDSYRASLGWVSQDVVLFSKTLRENLTLGRSNISDKEIWDALEFVQLKEWVERLPRKLDEELPERGSRFSSGQRQLISVARAMITRPSILIFDEATSYIDSHTEFVLQQSIDRLFQGPQFQATTCFFIAHRLSTLKRCDRMLVFRSGSIVEAGTFQSLMEQNGYAAHLYREQYRKMAS